jgi:hypothetical protein
MSARTILLLLACAGVAPANEVDLIDIYAGSWAVEITQADTPFSHAGIENTAIRNDCWHSGEFQVCHQYVDGKSVALLVFDCRAASTACASYPITPESDGVHRATVSVEGRTVIYPWQEEREGGTIYFRVVNTITSHGRIDYRREYSDDQVHWRTMATGHETRLR